MPDRNRAQSPDLADALDRYWDAILDGTSDLPSTDFDPGLAATARRVHALDAAPSPHPVFASTLWEDLMSAHTMSSQLTAQPDSVLRVRPLHEPGRWLAQSRSQSLSRLLAAIPLIALLAGSAFAALYPLRWWESGRTPLVAPPMTEVATLEAEAAAGFEFLWEFDGDSDRLQNAYGMAVDEDGNLWVSDAGNDRIQIIAPDGTHLDTWGVSGSGDGEFEFKSRNQLYGLPYADIAFDADSNIYVLDTGNARIQKLGPDRTFIRSWGSEGKGEGQFVLPISVVVGPNGVVYVSDETRNDIQMFDQDGNYLGAFGGPGSAEGELSLASGLAFDGAGRLWVADWGNDRMQVFSAKGEFLAVWGESGLDDGQLNSPNDVAVDYHNHVFIADDISHRLQAFTLDGHFLASIGGRGTDPGKFNYPVGTALGQDGAVYVSDRERVQAFRLVLPAWQSLVP